MPLYCFIRLTGVHAPLASVGLALISGTAFAQTQVHALSAQSVSGGAGSFLAAARTDVSGAAAAADSFRSLDTLLRQLNALNRVDFSGYISSIETTSRSSAARAGTNAGVEGVGGGASRPLFFNRSFPITGSSGPPPAVLTSAYTDTENSTVYETGNTNLNGFALTYNGSGGIIAQGILSGTGSGSTVTYSGTGFIQITGANTYAGGTTVSSGTLYVGFNGSTANTASLGTGNITVNSGGSLNFYAASSAGASAATTLTNNYDTVFRNTSTAGGTTIFNNLEFEFVDSSTAGSSTITNTYGGGDMYFYNTSSAGTATITNTSNGIILFLDSSTAGSSVITNTGGSAIYFQDTSTANNATIVNNATTGRLDISSMTAATGLSIGSLSGSGNVYLGSHMLTVDGLVGNPSTTINGIIRDGGINGGTGGSLVKAGTGTLTLTGANTYTGGTTINAGRVVAGGTALGTGGVAIASGATLSVGEAPNATTSAITTHALSAASLAVTAGSTTPLLTFNLGASGVSDALNLTGSGSELTYSGAGTFDIGFASATGKSLGAGTYTLITFATPESPTAAPLITQYAASPTGNLANVKGGVSGTGTFLYTLSGGNIIALQYTITGADATPEPAALLLLALGLPALGGAFVLRRRATHSALTYQA